MNLEKKIAEGGGGIVYKATYLDHDVAVKRVFASRSGIEGLREFCNEISILHKISSGSPHPNLLRLYGICRDHARDDVCIVMEFCETSLIDVLKGNSKICGLYDEDSVSRTWNIAKQTQRGMTFLHSKSITHRDLKPHNLLMNVSGKSIQVKIADFGISRVFGPEDKDITRYTGTITYMAPELLNDDIQSIDMLGAKRADVWSFGVTLSAMVLRGDPWPVDLKKFTLVRRICENKERPRLPSQCPSDYAKLVKLCLSADPKSRPSFDDMKLMLK